MRPLRAILPLCLLATALVASGKTTAKAPKAFARLTLDARDATIHLGDSAVVYLTLYATMPFERAEIKAPKLKIKNCAVRRAAIRRRQNITTVQGQSYYTMTCAAFVVKPRKRGKFTFPALRFDGTVLRQEPQQRRLDPFWGPFDDFFYQPTYKQLPVSGKAKAVKFRAQPAPPKTLEQLRREGRTIL